MLNRRYLGWLIAGAYAAPQGGFRAPDARTLAAAGTATAAGNDDRATPAAEIRGVAFFAADATYSSRGSHPSITAQG